MNHSALDPAVVIGAGIAGLLCAHVLASHHYRVVLIERDKLPEGPLHRTGVPQDQHVHALFAGGLRAVQALLPGFAQQLCDRGGQRIDVCRDLLIASRYGYGQRFVSGLEVIGASRPLLEAALRERVTASPRVTVLDEHQIIDLLGDTGHIRAVRVHDRVNGCARELPTTVIVDATGRGSRLPALLAQLGCPPIPETTVDAHVRYATRIYRRTGIPTDSKWRACYTPARGPATTRGAVLAPIERDRWMLTLTAVGTDRPPASDDGFLPFARSLLTPVIAETLTGTEPLTSVRHSNSTTNRRRHYDRLAAHLPDNLIAVGDSACALNPVYAQGMTLAAQQAHLLDAWLRNPRTADHYHRRLARLINPAWTLATTADFRFPTTDGPPTVARHPRLGNYIDHLIAAGVHDPHAEKAFLNVMNMVCHPATLLNPVLAVHVARSRRHHHLAATAQVATSQ